MVMKMSLLCRCGFYECGRDDVIAIVQAVLEGCGHDDVRGGF